MTLKPFFTYYGGKYRAAPKYPTPQYDTIIEPFAGAAGYSLRYADRNVVLYDKDPVIAGLWTWLTRVSASEILSLPIKVEHVDSLDVCQEAKWLIGFWLNKGAAAPMKSPSKWMRDGTRPNSYWGETIRQRIASQVNSIRHWRVFNTSYEYVLPERATYFVDPPYQEAGKHYRYSASGLDFANLAEWCRTRPGQVIVCENAGAAWLPFQPFAHIKANESRRGGKQSAEVIWLNA